jgi:PhoH-like ATPase
MANKIFVDTNILLNPNFDFNDYEKVFMSIITVEELDNQKTREDIGYLARKATRNIENATNKEIILNSTYDITEFHEHKNDNLIISHALEVYKNDKEVLFITDDLNVKLKSDAIGLPCERYKFKEQNIELYKI